MNGGKTVRKSFFASAFALQLFQFGLGTGEPMLDNADVHAIVGEPARVARFGPADGQLNVVSWNIAQGKRYDLIRDTLKGLDADVYLLQEVDMGVQRSEHRQVARELAHDLGLNWVFAGEFQELAQGRRGSPAVTGQAVLSRFVIDDPVALPFENQARWRWRLDPFQPRRGGRMALRARSGGVVFYNAHIESAGNDRFRHKQVDEMLFDHLFSARVDLPVVFAGDFNTGVPPGDSPLVRCLLAEGFFDALGTPSLRRTSINHDQPLDWIFIRNTRSGGGRVVEVPKASDHFLLEAAIGTPARALRAQ
jgi:endonuclease/exonuclease/phosphatase family metal-dependent hydrolase